MANRRKIKIDWKRTDKLAYALGFAILLGLLTNLVLSLCGGAVLKRGSEDFWLVMLTFGIPIFFVGAPDKRDRGDPTAQFTKFAIILFFWAPLVTCGGYSNYKSAKERKKFAHVYEARKKEPIKQVSKANSNLAKLNPVEILASGDEAATAVLKRRLREGKFKIDDTFTIDKDVQGTLLHYICLHPDTEAFKVAMLHEADVNAKDSLGRKPGDLLKSQWPPTRNNPELMLELTKRGYKLTMEKNENGRSYLHIMAASPNLSLTHNSLMEIYQDALNEQDNFGWTPSFYAALVNPESLAELQRLGADHSVRSTKAQIWDMVEFPVGTTVSDCLKRSQEIEQMNVDK